MQRMCADPQLLAQMHARYTRLKYDFEKELAHMGYEDYNNAIGQAIGAQNIFGNNNLGQQIGAMNQLGNSLTGLPPGLMPSTGGNDVNPLKTKAEYGTLYMNGRELPDDWRGAMYTGFDRVAMKEAWKLVFKSPWANDKIEVYIDLEKHSGAEVNAMAKTFIEIINQRRLG